MIAHLPYDALFSDLNIVAYKLLMYLGAKHTQEAGWYSVWCWKSLPELAEAVSSPEARYSQRSVGKAYAQLLECGYIECCEGRFLQHYEGDDGHIRTRSLTRTCFRVKLTLEQ